MLVFGSFGLDDVVYCMGVAVANLDYTKWAALEKTLGPVCGCGCCYVLLIWLSVYERIVWV